MKRSELHRTAPLKASSDTTREFVNRGRRASAQGLKRRTADSRPAKDKVMQLCGFKRQEFRDEVAECRVVGCGGGVVHQHHVIFRQHVEREHGDRWDPGNALGLCLMHHSEAHGLRRLDVSNLRDENYAFAAELFGVQRAYLYLRRYYVGDDPRLDALMAEEAA